MGKHPLFTAFYVYKGQKMSNTVSKQMFGRRVIYTDAKEITKDNLITELLKAFNVHILNRGEIEYLYNYYKGDQPILYRTKEIREDIVNKVVENRANQIVSFKVGYLCGNPIQYISRNANSDLTDQIDKLNALMNVEGKSAKDKELFEWQMIAGTSYRMVLPNEDVEDKEDCPFEITTLDPRNTFIIYSSDVSHKPLAAVYYVRHGEPLVDGNLYKMFSVYTKNMYFEVEENKIVTAKPHAFNIPIVEYPANNARMGAFEPVLSLLDAINEVDSNRVDGIEQFIQSLMVLYNCTLGDETTTSVQQKGIIELKSVGDNKADIKILNEQLNQSETQTLKDDMYQTVLEIVGMPSQGNGSSDSSNNGAVILKNGWQGAEARAKDSELLFKQSEQKFLKLVLRICRDLSDIDIKVIDIEPHFTRRNYEDILSKSQVLTTMLASEKIAPKLAFQTCGLFIDSEEAYKESVEWIAEQEEKKKQEALENAEMQMMNGEGSETDDSEGASADNTNEGDDNATWNRKKRGVMCKETGQVYSSGIEAERQNGIAKGKISVAIKTGGIAGGYHWTYA